MLLGPRLREPGDVGAADHERRTRRRPGLDPAADREQRRPERHEVHERRAEETRHQCPVATSVAPRAVHSRVCEVR